MIMKKSNIGRVSIIKHLFNFTGMVKVKILIFTYWFPIRAFIKRVLRNSLINFDNQLDSVLYTGDERERKQVKLQSSGKHYTPIHGGSLK
jgi:hypothetical protein